MDSESTQTHFSRRPQRSTDFHPREMPSPTGAVKGGKSRYLSGPSPEEYQNAIDFAIKLAAHNDNQEETSKTRRILLQEWLFATDGPFDTDCSPHDGTEAVQQQGYAENDAINNQLAAKVELSWNVSTVLPT
ncbi:hypothetical protein V502_06609 [Pseudogymnoascus sp. VKM F-4520 (FW-2644)]|nr:hypothetical protein V502_06609 [Pseudogymnoascus sp. VKM F-4520 (FW-2644)]